MGRREGPYVYVNADGTPNRKVVRRPGKEFPQFSPLPGGRWKAGLNGQPPVLYRLPEVIEAVEQGHPVYVVEGEKDVEAAREVGAVATTNPGGAGKWTDDLSSPSRAPTSS